MNAERLGEDLHEQVLRFRAWSAEAMDIPEAERGGSWECDYEHWSSLHRVALTFLAQRHPSGWTERETDDLLYAIARDNEIEYLVKEVAIHPSSLVALAHRALARGDETHAMWQLADRLPSIAPHPDIEPLLLRFVRATDEYVRRRALLALGRFRSPQAVSLAIAAWNADHDMQVWTRMAVLHVLHSLSSPHFETYLAEAERDPRPELSRLAANLRSPEKPTGARLRRPATRRARRPTNAHGGGGHRKPAGDASSIELLVHLPHHWAVAAECMWAAALGDDLHQLRNTPFHAYDLNLGDVVVATVDASGSRPVVREVVRRSGHQTVRLMFKKGVTRAEQMRFLHSLESLDVSFERADERYVALDLAPAADLTKVRAELDRPDRRRLAAYETCEARIAGSFDAEAD